MAAPVWVLSVDLQAKTATFQTGMSEAARAARGAFNDIGSGAEGMGGRMSRGMTEARHSLMMLGEQFGVHIPRAVATMLASLGPVGAAMEAAFPFLAIITLATLLTEHLSKIHEGGEKLTADQIHFGIATQEAFGQLNDKLIQAQIKADELRNDHLGALRLQMDLIDHQSMAELIHSFEEVQKTADTVLKDLEGRWYTLGIGSDGAKAALVDFKNKYDALLASQTETGKKEASNLLAGTLKTAREVLAAQEQIKANRDGGAGNTDESYQAEQALKAHQASLTVTGKEIEAQEAVVRALEQQVRNEEVINRTKEQDKSNTKTTAGNEEAARRASAAKAAADSQMRLAEQAIAADKAQAAAALTIHRASLEERLNSDMEFAGRERDVKLATNTAEIAALDKSGKDFQNQLKALNEKALEINGEYDTKIAELKAKASVELYQRDLTALEQSIRGQIEATKEGSAARVSAVDAGLREAQAHQLQDTEFYRELCNQRVEATRQEAEGEQRIADQKIAAQIDGVQRAAEEQIKHRATQIRTQDGTGSLQDLSRVAQERQIGDMTYALQKQALQQELALYKQMGNEKVKEAQKTLQAIDLLDREHVDKSADLDAQQAQVTRNALAQIGNDYAHTFMGVMTGHESLAKTEERLAQQGVSHMLQAAIQMMAGDKATQLSHARAAAAGAYNAMSNIPVVGPGLGALAAAAVFTGAMAFEGGTDRVPGVGRGDIVPAMLTPGEGIVPGGVMDGLSRVARNGGFDSGQNITVHIRPTYHVQTIDGDGMQDALERHTDQLQRHFENALRRMNR